MHTKSYSKLYVLVLNFEFKNFFFLLIAKEKTPEILPYMG